MISSLPWANVVRSDPMRRDLSDADRYVRREYGGPDATWLLSTRQFSAAPESSCAAPSSERLVRRITQAIASFLL